MKTLFWIALVAMLFFAFRAAYESKRPIDGAWTEKSYRDQCTIMMVEEGVTK